MGTICSSPASHESIKAISQQPSKNSSNGSPPQSNNHNPSTKQDTTDTPKHDPSIGHPGEDDKQQTLSRSSNHRPPTARPETAPPVTLDPEVVRLPCLEQLPLSVARRVCGRVLEERWTPALEDKVIRVYHLAHLTDSHEERDVLLQRVYPHLQTFCLEHGFDLDVIDLHWGQRDPYVTSENVGIPPQDYLRSLLQEDKNIIIVIFLGEKYGAYGCPVQIAQEHLSPILEELSNDDRALIDQWYRLDENSIPNEYVLQPIRAHIPNYRSDIDQEHREACSDWSEIRDRISDVLWESSDQEFRNLYLKSELEQELEESVLNDRCIVDNVVLVRRTFKNKGVRSASPQQMSDYTDVKMGALDKTAQTRLKNLTNRLNDKVEPSNRIELEVGWQPGGVTTDHPDHIKYLKTLSTRYKDTLRTAMEKAIEAKGVFNRIRVNMVGAGMQKYLYDDVLHHTLVSQELSHYVIGQDDVFDQMRSYVMDGHPTGSSQHIRPLVVAGKSGSGKSTMAATLAVKSCMMRGWTKSVCIVRHIGCGPGCQSLDEAIASVGVHMCFLFGLPYSYAHKPVTMFPGSFRQLLNKVPDTTWLLIVLDGVDLLSDVRNAEWLPDELPCHVRLVVTTTEGTPTHDTLKNLPWQNEGYSVTIPDLQPTDALTLVHKYLSDSDRQLTASQSETLEGAVQLNPNPLYIRLAALTAIHWKSYTEKDDLQLGSTVKDLLWKGLIGRLEGCHGDEPIGRLLTYLSVLQEGISDTEVKDILSWDEGFLQPIYLHEEPVVRRAPSHIWVDVVNFLQYCLLRVTSTGGVVLTKWRHRILEDIVLDVCRCYEAQTWMKVLDYYEGRWANGKQMPYAANEKGLEYLQDRLARDQPVKHKNNYNHRKLEQISGCLIHNDMFKTLRDEFLLNLENLTHMLTALSLYRVLHCMKLYLDAEEDDLDVRFMFNLLRKNANVVWQGSDHLWSQFFLRVQSGKLDISEFPAILELFTALSASVKSNSDISSPFLIPSSPEVLDILDTNQLKPKPVLHGLFLVPGDRTHVISISSDEGDIIVWNIHHQVAVRTLSNLPQPKSLKMIDHIRSVILCNRELRIYNIERGIEECRLKGVLNLKMPYFGVLDSEHTVALSRNRMYVNIIKNSTGDTDATFKVGEDRFLDSLIISANGEWCVCGDQVQKPFPLLVWDLVNRKLVHDMRLAGHEFVTRMAAITAEGHYVVCVCRYASAPSKRYSIIERAAGYTDEEKDKTLAEPNFLIVYDLQSGSLFKKWKPAYSTTSVEMSSASNLVISGHEDGSVHVWDLIGGALKHQLMGHSRGPDHISVSEDGDRAATCDLSCSDTSVRLWDLEEGVCLGSFVTEYGFTCCQISPEGNIVIVGVPGSGKIVCLWADTDEQEKSKMDISIYGDASRNKLCFSMDD